MSIVQRGPRPAIRWLYLAVGLASFGFLIAISIPILRAANRWADGEPIDMMGFAALVTAAGGAMAQLIAQGAQVFQNYHRERMDQQARGIPPSGVPFPQPPEPPGQGGGVGNTNAIEDQQR